MSSFGQPTKVICSLINSRWKFAYAYAVQSAATSSFAPSNQGAVTGTSLICTGHWRSSDSCCTIIDANCCTSSGDTSPFCTVFLPASTVLVFLSYRSLLNVFIAVPGQPHGSGSPDGLPAPFTVFSAFAANTATSS